MKTSLFMTNPSFFQWHCLSFFFLVLSNLPAQQMSPALQKVWNVYYSDVGGDNDEHTRAEEPLANRPEFKSELFAILQYEYFDAVKRGEFGSGGALGALALRNDLTPAEQKLITDELGTHIAETDESSFIRGAINLLAHYPSPEHEALVLRFLNRSAKKNYILLAAFHTLTKIGGGKSLIAMRKVVERMKAENARYGFLEDMDRYLTGLQDRLEHHTAAPVPPQAEAATTQPPQPAIPATVSGSPETPQVGTTDRLVWLGMIIGLLLVVSLACRAFRK